MRARWAMALTAVLALLLSGTTATAWAVPPQQLGDSYILDQAGVLTGDEEVAMSTRMTQLYKATGADLFVMFVDSFTDPTSPQQWANRVAQDNGLGVKQYLLAIAVDTRQYYLSADDSGPLTGAQVAQIEADIKPQLTQGDWIGAADTAAQSIQELLAPAAPATAVAGPSAGSIVLIAVVLLAGVALSIWLIARRRRKNHADDPSVAAPPEPTLEQLAREASSALVATDDALKTSDQELGFARAQFGDEATTEFAAAIERANQSLTEAFSIKQRLDDEVPDTEAEVREGNARIIELCADANADLDAKAAAFDELRRIEQNAPDALARVRAAREEAAAGTDAASRRLAELSNAYAPEALATIDDNPAQARDRISFADAQLAEADADLAAGRSGEAAVGIRAAEAALAQARLLQHAVDRLGADLSAAEQAIARLLAELEADVASAQALPDPDGRVASAVAAARAQVEAARATPPGARRHPLAALQALQAVNAEIDGVMQGARDAEAQAERVRQQVGQTILEAQAQVSAAEDYITARRGAVGAQARTRLAEAGASLVRAQALQATDSARALQDAQRAAQLAGEAIRSAQADVGAFSGGGLGGAFGGGAPTGAGGGMLGAVLGGIVLNSVLGGGVGGASGASGTTASRTRVQPGGFGGTGSRDRRGGGRF